MAKAHPPSFTPQQIKALAKVVHDEMYSIENTLKRRGYVCAGKGHAENVILPCRQSDIDRFFRYMGSRTFRQILKKIINKRCDIYHADFATECSPMKLREYLGFLENSSILTKQSVSSFSLALSVDDFGYTFEWYVSELFKRELSCTAEWGIRVKNINVGGDYDVLARVEAQLVYVETKSASPESISSSEIKHFLQRDQELDPDISIFLVDSRNDLSNLVTRFEEIITPIVVEDATIRNPDYHYKIQQHLDFGGIFHLSRRIFIIRSKPAILTNLRHCLNYYFAIVTHSSYWSRSKRMNFV